MPIFKEFQNKTTKDGAKTYVLVPHEGKNCYVWDADLIAKITAGEETGEVELQDGKYPRLVKKGEAVISTDDKKSGWAAKDAKINRLNARTVAGQAAATLAVAAAPEGASSDDIATVFETLSERFFTFLLEKLASE